MGSEVAHAGRVLVRCGSRQGPPGSTPLQPKKGVNRRGRTMAGVACVSPSLSTGVLCFRSGN